MKAKLTFKDNTSYIVDYETMEELSSIEAEYNQKFPDNKITAIADAEEPAKEAPKSKAEEPAEVEAPSAPVEVPEKKEEPKIEEAEKEHENLKNKTLSFLEKEAKLTKEDAKAIYGGIASGLYKTLNLVAPSGSAMEKFLKKQNDYWEKDEEIQNHPFIKTASEEITKAIPIGRLGKTLSLGKEALKDVLEKKGILSAPKVIMKEPASKVLGAGAEGAALSGISTLEDEKMKEGNIDYDRVIGSAGAGAVLNSSLSKFAQLGGKYLKGKNFREYLEKIGVNPTISQEIGAGENDFLKKRENELFASGLDSGQRDKNIEKVLQHLQNLHEDTISKLEKADSENIVQEFLPVYTKKKLLNEQKYASASSKLNSAPLNISDTKSAMKEALADYRNRKVSSTKIEAMKRFILNTGKNLGGKNSFKDVLQLRKDLDDIIYSKKLDDIELKDTDLSAIKNIRSKINQDFEKELKFNPKYKEGYIEFKAADYDFQKNILPMFKGKNQTGKRIKKAVELEMSDFDSGMDNAEFLKSLQLDKKRNISDFVNQLDSAEAEKNIINHFIDNAYLRASAGNNFSTRKFANDLNSDFFKTLVRRNDMEKEIQGLKKLITEPEFHAETLTPKTGERAIGGMLSILSGIGVGGVASGSEGLTALLAPLALGKAFATANASPTFRKTLRNLAEEAYNIENNNHSALTKHIAENLAPSLSPAKINHIKKELPNLLLRMSMKKEEEAKRKNDRIDKENNSIKSQNGYG